MAKAKKAAARKPAPATKAAPIDAASPPLPLHAELPVDSVHPSDLNPRRRMDEASLAELAASIVANGVLQPILVRPMPDRDGHYEVICGARRVIAARHAVEAGHLPKSFRIPARIRPCSDEELVTLAATENLARKDMLPLEEARVFDALRQVVQPQKGETKEAAVARILGTSERTVFRRLALLRLAPEIRVALEDGKISLAQAAAYALGDHDAQRRQWKLAQEHEWQSQPDYIRRHMTETRVPFRRALFDPALYKGEILHDAETGEQYFVDLEQFQKLQGAAVEAKLAELRKTWKWAEWVPGNERHRYVPTNKKDADAGAVVYADYEGVIHVDAPVLRPDTVKARQQQAARDRAAEGKTDLFAGEEESASGDDRDDRRAALHARIWALREEAAGNRRLGLAMAVLALLGIDELVPDMSILGMPLPYQERRRRVLGALAELGVDPASQDLWREIDDDKRPRALEALLGLDEAQLVEAVAALAVECWTPNRDWNTRAIDPTPLDRAIAAAAGVELDAAPLQEAAE